MVLMFATEELLTCRGMKEHLAVDDRNHNAKLGFCLVENPIKPTVLDHIHLVNSRINNGI